MFGKKSTGTPAAPGVGAPPHQPAPLTPGVGASRTGGGEQQAQLTSPFSGILAGQVIDSYNRRPPPTFIRVVPGKDREGKDIGGAPIEVATDQSGYFTIQGLQPGRPYQLIAVSKDGPRKLAGATWATPPDPRLLIRVSEDFVTPSTPDPPASAGSPSKPEKPAETSRIPPPPNWPETSPVTIVQPVSPAGTRGPAELGRPIPRSDSPTGPGTAPPARASHPENVVDGGTAVAGIPRDPVLSTPTYVPPGGARPFAPTNPPTGSGSLTSVAPPVPFCVLLSNRKLDNFALNDVDGQPWEFRKNRRGRLVLLDFWYTTCIPCRNAVPHLNILQQNYGQYGLEVVSIACENGPIDEQARKVKSVRDRYGMNYKVLLGGGMNTKCPVRTQFQVTSFPTMILLDESGQIVHRSEGIDAQRVRELDFEIRRQLGLR